MYIQFKSDTGEAYCGSLARVVCTCRASSMTPFHDKPCAAPGLISYRAKDRYGWIMIGATDNADALREARRSTDNPTDLQRWNGSEYVNV